MAKKKSEWVLLVETSEYTQTINVDQSTFGPAIDWKNNKDYLFEFDIELTAITNPSLQIGIRDANTQSVTFFGGFGKHVGDTAHIRTIVASNRERHRALFIGRLYDNNVFSVFITNIKVYEHI